MREIEVAWAAGLFEGEGSITRTRRGHLHLCLSMTDKDVVDRFRAIAGVGSIGGWQGALPRKYAHQWYVDGQDAENWLREMLPYLGSRRSQRACELLAERADLIASLTAPRACAHCESVFHPEFKAGNRRQYCTLRCRDLARLGRRRGHRRKGVTHANH